MSTGLSNIADLLRVVEPERDETGTFPSCQHLLHLYQPSLLLVADVDGKLMAVDRLDALTPPDTAGRLAAELAECLAEKETCSLEVPGDAGPQLAFAVRLPRDGQRAILACLTPPSRAVERHLLAVHPAVVVGGAFAWASTQNMADNAMLRRRIQHLLAERETLKASHTEASAAAIQEREKRIREQQQHAMLEKLCQAAETANRAKGEFLANASHELRTPLTAILGYTELLLDPDLSRTEQQSHLQTIRRNSAVLLEIINDILDLSKIEAGKMSVERTRCPLWQTVEDLVSLMRVRATEERLNLEVDYDFPLPETIETDPVRLRQILMNLVGNALKFTEQGEVRITVRCTNRDTSDPRVHFIVADTGIGIAPDEMERLFQPFTQADASTTRRFGGTGLGLTISERLAKMLGGEIEVESQFGVGSTFTLSIDPGNLEGVHVLHSPPEHPTEEDQPAAPSGTRTLHGRVLLAEDGKDNQRLICHILKKAGLEVAVAENGRIACQLAAASLDEKRAFNLILMDMQMPEMDGYQATRRLRQDGWRGPIVALTAHAMAGDRQKCLNVGCDDYVSKPLQRDTFLATVERHLTGNVQDAAR